MATYPTLLSFWFLFSPSPLSLVPHLIIPIGSPPSLRTLSPLLFHPLFSSPLSTTSHIVRISYVLYYLSTHACSPIFSGPSLVFSSSVVAGLFVLTLFLPYPPISFSFPFWGTHWTFLSLYLFLYFLWFFFFFVGSGIGRFFMCLCFDSYSYSHPVPLLTPDIFFLTSLTPNSYLRNCFLWVWLF